MAAHPKTCICARCGAAASVLDWAYQAPDCVWAQPAAERSALNNEDFAELGERLFVRGLLPVRLEDGEEFRYGIWLEVDLETFKKVLQSWNDRKRYARLRFAARIANAVPPWHDKILGVEVDVGVRDPTSRPFIVTARVRWLQAVIEHGWTTAEHKAVVESLPGFPGKTWQE